MIRYNIWIYIVASSIIHYIFLASYPQKYPKIAKRDSINIEVSPQFKTTPDYTAPNLNPNTILPLENNMTPIAGSSGNPSLDSAAPPGLLSPAFLYYTFFQRIKSQVDPLWSSGIRQHLARLKNTKDIKHLQIGATEVIITIDRLGDIKNIQLIKSCGYKPFDDIALNVLKGRRFPNPPREIFDKGDVVMIKWSYLVFL